MAVIDVTTQEDREKLEDRLAVIERLAAKHRAHTEQAKLVAAQAQIRDELVAERATVGANLRRGLVREKPALGAVLEAQLTNAAVERDGSSDIIKLHTNDDATNFQAQ